MNGVACRALLPLLVLCVSCSATPPSDTETCTDELARPLLNATPTETYLGLGESQRRALVEIVDDATLETSCSGVFVAPTWILTAEHCGAISNPVAVVAAGSQSPSARIPIVHHEAFSGRDVALFQVDFIGATLGAEHPGSAGTQQLDVLALGVTPISIPSEKILQVAPGVAVELAGYGVREDGGAGELRFLVETISMSTGTQVTVNGFGQSGACDGDSGGPLLMRAADGSLVVVGVLSSGSATCLYQDVYTRTDTSDVRSWVDGVIGTYNAVSRQCGSVSEEGRCLNGSAIWCSAGMLTAEACSASSPCGWSEAVSGFRCVEGNPACADVDAVGVCRNNSSMRCVNARIQTESCGPCSQCRVNGETGAPSCR